MNPNQPKNWKDDPRLRTMNPEKVAFLDRLACEIQKTPKDQLMNRFLSLTLEAKEAGMVFTDQVDRSYGRNSGELYVSH